MRHIQVNVGAAKAILWRIIHELPIVLLSQSALIALDVLHLPLRFGKKKRIQQGRISLEAGTRGWDSIYFSEMIQSACEYFGPSNVQKIEIKSEFKGERVTSLRNLMTGFGTTHYVYDPRSNPTTALIAIIEAIKINLFCFRNGIKTLVTLTDASVTLWRLQSLIVSHQNGVIFSPMQTSELGWLTWRVNISGPFIMPLSKQTLSNLETLQSDRPLSEDSFKKIQFRGTLYPTRFVFFEELNNTLDSLDSDIQVVAHPKSEFAVTSQSYWSGLSSNRICITTSFQYVFEGFRVDRVHINQMVFRITEALAAGNLLFLSDCPGVDKYFTEGIDYVGFISVEDLATKLLRYSESIEAAERIRITGHTRAVDLISNQVFWHEILNLIADESRNYG